MSCIELLVRNFVHGSITALGHEFFCSLPFVLPDSQVTFACYCNVFFFIDGDNLNNIRRETSRHFRNKTRECLKDKIDELATNSKNKNKNKNKETYIEE
jgi:hypothetical protein